MNRKNENSVLDEFKHLSEYDLMIEIYDEVTRFMVLTKSEEEATKILEKYGKKAHFIFNVSKKTKYHRLMVCAKLMNLVVPRGWYDVNITEYDVIERIKEFMYDEIKWINLYSYMSDVFNNNDCMVCDDDLSSDTKIGEIIAFYEDVITKEFGEGKKLVR